MKKILFFAITLGLFAGCANKPAPANLPEEKIVKVTTTPVRQQNVTATLRYSGTIEAIQTIPLSFQTTGTVETVLVDAGDEVKKGQVLATLNDADARNMYQITLAKYEQAKDAYDRLKQVYDKGSLPEIKWIEMEANLEQAKSSLEISKHNLEKCKLYSPVSGLVGQRNIEPGMSSLLIGSAPLQLVDIKQVYVKISVPENEIAKISKGLKAEFKVSALGGKKFEGTITNVSPVADQISRTYEAKLKVENPLGELKPGMVCDVAMLQTGEKEMVLIPYQSVSVDQENNRFVYVVDTVEKRAKKQTITTGEYQGSDLEVLSGLAQGRVVVSEGKEEVLDN